MPKRTTKGSEPQEQRIEVPTNAPTMLATFNNMLRMRRQELQVLVEGGQAYVKSIGLDPATDYRFAVDGDKVYAIEVTEAMREQLAQATVQGRVAEAKE